MSNLQFIDQFDPFKDDAEEFLERVREEYDGRYGKWHQKHVDEDGENYIEVDIRTGGWSDNEEVVNELLANNLIRMLYYHSWTRGGQHVFRFKNRVAR
jgi:hypothetical protein